MMYNQIECPTCGNTVTAKSVDEPQKCKWCRRLFKVNIIRKNKEGKKAKYNWTAEPVDFDDNNMNRRGPKSLDDWYDNDIYGARK